MQVPLRQVIEFFSSIDATDIVTTAMIVGGTSAVTLYIYFHSLTPTFRIVKRESGRLLGINDVNRSISACTISLDGEKLIWDHNDKRDRKYIAPGEGGNVIIRDDMFPKERSWVVIKNGRKTLKKLRWADIPPE